MVSPNNGLLQNAFYLCIKLRVPLRKHYCGGWGAFGGAHRFCFLSEGGGPNFAKYYTYNYKKN